MSAVYFAAVLLDKRFKGATWQPKQRIVNYALLAVCGLMVLLLVFQNLWDTSVLYFMLYPIAVFLLLIAIVYGAPSKKYPLIILVVVLQLIVYSLVVAPSGVFLTERTPAFLALQNAQSWNANTSATGRLNGYYNTFPTDLGLFYEFSQVTGVAYTASLCMWLVSLFFILAYDLILYSLVKNIGGHWKIGVLSILLLTFTPPLALNPQPEWLANLFVLLFLFGLFMALKGKPPLYYGALAILCYLVAILLHGTALIGAVVVSIMLGVMFFGRRLGLNIETTPKQQNLAIIVAVLVYAISIWRLLILGGVISILTPMSGLTNKLLNQHSGGSSVFTNYVPLYNQYVSPIVAYAWSIPIALAFTFLLYQIVKARARHRIVNRSRGKSINVVFLISLCLGGAALAFFGFLGGILAGSSNLQRYLGYAGLSLLIPVAAVAGAKVLRSRSWQVLCVCLISIVAFSAIAISDPAFSPQLYPNYQSVGATSSADMVEANTLYNVLSTAKPVVATYAISDAFDCLSVLGGSSAKTIPIYGGSLKTERAMIENLTCTQGGQSNVAYVWTPEILQAANNTLFDAVYDSGRYVVIESGTP